MTTIREDQQRYEDIITEIGKLTEEALNLLPESVYDNAKPYWYTHITTALNDNNKFVGRSICNMQDTLEEWEEFSMSSYIPSDSSVDGVYVEPSYDAFKMEFTYESVNDALYKKHPNLSGEWSTLDWDETHAVASYMLEDGTTEDALVDREGNVEVSDKLLNEMKLI